MPPKKTATTRERVILDNDPAGEAWHLDKRIPVTIIIELLLNFAASIWWASKTDARLLTVEHALTIVTADHDSITRIEANVDNIAARQQQDGQQDGRR